MGLKIPPVAMPDSDDGKIEFEKSGRFGVTFTATLFMVVMVILLFAALLILSLSLMAILVIVALGVMLLVLLLVLSHLGFRLKIEREP